MFNTSKSCNADNDNGNYVNEKETCFEKFAKILNEQAKLTFEDAEGSSSSLCQMLKSQIQNHQLQIKIESNKIQRIKQKSSQLELIQNCVFKIDELYEKIDKLKQFFIFCQFLKKQSHELQDNIEKYFEYLKKKSKLALELQTYLSDPIISDAIFKQYLKCYNVNIFISDLIKHYFNLNVHGLLKQTQQQIYETQRIAELVLLQKSNIVFKQLYEINEKYTNFQKQHNNSYIRLIAQLVDQLNSVETEQQKVPKNKRTQIFEGYDKDMSEKLINLNGILHKVSGSGVIPGLISKQQAEFTSLMVKQCKNNFNLLRSSTIENHLSELQVINSQYKDFLIGIFTRNPLSASSMSEQKSIDDQIKKLFEAHLKDEQIERQRRFSINESCNFNNLPQKPKQFQFLRHKIIRVQTIQLLNKIFSSFNVVSYIMEQLNEDPGQQTQFYYGSFSKFIEADFRCFLVREKEFVLDQQGQRLPSKSQRATSTYNVTNSNTNIFIEIDEHDNWIIGSGNHQQNQQKLVYPSAIANLGEFIKYMVLMASYFTEQNLFSSQFMLNILSLKAEQIYKCGEVIYNIFNVIKTKQINCYELLKNYISVSFQGFFSYQLQWIQKIDLSKQQQAQFSNKMENIQTSLANLANSQNQRNQLIRVQLQKQMIQSRSNLLEEIKQIKITKYITFFAQKSKKHDFLSQIIYEVDSNYQISPVLKELLICEQHLKNSFYFQDNPYFYQTVLYEIIQIRNNIKLDRFYNLSKLHDSFGFFPAKSLSFGDILSQLSHYSTKRIKIEEILVFFRTQLKLKRIVFKGQLFWIGYKKILNDGKNKTFRQFLDQQAKSIMDVIQKPIKYFLQNIKEFENDVNRLQEKIWRFSYIQIIYKKCQESFQKIKIVNFQLYLKDLSFQELREFSKVVCNKNPVSQILKQQNLTDQILTQFKMSMHEKVKFQCISQYINLFDEKLKLSNSMFLMESFAFDLSYSDCFNIFLQDQKKSYIGRNQALKLSISRQKARISKHLRQISYQQKKGILLATSFYDKMTLLALLLQQKQQKHQQQQTQQSSIDYIESKLIEQIIINLTGINLSKIKQNLISMLQHYHQSNNDLQSSKQEAQLNYLLKIKQIIIQFCHYDQFEQSQNKFIENVCLISKLSGITKRKIAQKIQKIHHQIAETLVERQSNVNKKVNKQVDFLNNKIFIFVILSPLQEYFKQNKFAFLNDSLRSKELLLRQLQKKIKEKIKTLYSFQNAFTLTTTNKEQLHLFNELSGYKVINTQQNKNIDGCNYVASLHKKGLLKRIDRKNNNKRAIFSPERPSEKYSILQSIQKRVNIQMIRQSMGLRKFIASLQLDDKQMKDQIAWQTSKLQYSVINKINAFITQSNIDQEQSYTNFKHTVNLETIKGMENVIQEQTDLAIKTSKNQIKKVLQAPVMIKQDNGNTNEKAEVTQIDDNGKEKYFQEKGGFFLTNPTQAFESPQSKLQYQNSRLLNMNIDSIFNHLKKIRIFAAWKKIHRNMNFTKQQWSKFNKNVAVILHNQDNLAAITEINEKRNSCFKESILCSLLKEENDIISKKIRDLKVDSLNKVIQQYHVNHLRGNSSSVVTQANQITQEALKK